MANQMTKAQLVAELASRTGSDKKSAGAMLDALTGIITETVAQGGAVTLPGVGKIYCRERPERMVLVRVARVVVVVPMMMPRPMVMPAKPVPVARPVAMMVEPAPAQMAQGPRGLGHQLQPAEPGAERVAQLAVGDVRPRRVRPLPLDVVMMALLRAPHLGLEAQHLRAVLAHLAVRRRHALADAAGDRRRDARRGSVRPDDARARPPRRGARGPRRAGTDPRRLARAPGGRRGHLARRRDRLTHAGGAAPSDARRSDTDRTGPHRTPRT